MSNGVFSAVTLLVGRVFLVNENKNPNLSVFSNVDLIVQKMQKLLLVLTFVSTVKLFSKILVVMLLFFFFSLDLQRFLSFVRSRLAKSIFTMKSELSFVFLWKVLFISFPPSDPHAKKRSTSFCLRLVLNISEWRNVVHKSDILCFSSYCFLRNNDVLSSIAVCISCPLHVESDAKENCHSFHPLES